MKMWTSIVSTIILARDLSLERAEEGDVYGSEGNYHSGRSEVSAIPGHNHKIYALYTEFLHCK